MTKRDPARPPMPGLTRRRAIVFAIALAAMARLFVPSAWPASDPPVAEREYSQLYDAVDHSIVRPITRTLDLARWVRAVSGNPREAANVDEQDRVRLPSTWWQPRIGFLAVTPEQMLRGPGRSRGPAPGKWSVTKAKSEGVTPGIQIEDSKGDAFLIKFDALAYPELATGADAIGSVLFWAAGYNVPENDVVHFRVADLDIAKDATYTDGLGQKQPITREYLDDLMKRVARRPDGTYRALASRYLPGRPLGPFEYQGRRTDDPEDLIPHELRRELRGLWTIAAWVNHADVRGPNSLDMWVTENGRSFVRHHLIDFGSILGSSAVGKRSYVTGTEYYLDYGVIARQVATVGLRPFAWETVKDPELPCVGFIEAEAFDPKRWRPDYPNPAFDERTDRDVRWGARIVAGFTDAHIRAAVSAGKFSDPRCAEYLTRVLIERRNAIERYWLGEADARRAGR